MSAVILVLHHDPVTRAFISHVVEQHGGYVVVSADNALDAQEQLKEAAQIALTPDAILASLIDYRNSGEGRRLVNVAEFSNIPLLLLNDMPKDRSAPPPRAILVPADPRGLLLSMKAHLHSPVREDILERQGLRLNPGTLEAFAGHVRLDLTPLCFRLLYQMMQAPGRVFSREQLLNHVWRDQGIVEERTVDVHVYRLRSQLTRYGFGHLIQAVRGVGYRFVVETPKPVQPKTGKWRFAS